MATILIVDDNAINRSFLVTLLGYAGHRLLEAASGIDGLRLIRAERPDLVISDILMPNMDGHEFVTRIHADAAIAATPVIFYTAGYHETEARAIARSCGVQTVLAKPAEPEVILRTVNEALGLPSGDVSVPHLTVPPSEGSRFSTVDSQMAEYLSELESSTALIASLVADPASLQSAAPQRRQATQRLAASLDNLQEVSDRLAALMRIRVDVAAESAEPAAASPELEAPEESAARSVRDHPGETVRSVQPASPIADDTVGTVATGFGQQNSRERVKFQARLAKSLRFAGYPHDSPTQLAREFNFRYSGRPVTIHAARKWLVGESIPTQDKLRILATWLGVTAEWLRFGDTGETGETSAPQKTAPSSEESKLLADLMLLDPYHRKLAQDFIAMLVAKNTPAAGADRRPVKSRQPKDKVRLP